MSTWRDAGLSFRIMAEMPNAVILWPTEWWDGPGRGTAALNEQRFWFAAAFDEASDEYENPRRLILYELSDDEFRHETDRHRRFEETVGSTRYCFHLPPEQRHGPTTPRESWATFYEAEGERDVRSYEDRPSAGWFSPSA